VSEDPEDLIPYDLEANASRLWPQFPHEWLGVGDVIELKRGTETTRVRVTKVIPGPGGQVMYDTEPADGRPLPLAAEEKVYSAALPERLRAFEAHLNALLDGTLPEGTKFEWAPMSEFRNGATDRECEPDAKPADLRPDTHRLRLRAQGCRPARSHLLLDRPDAEGGRLPDTAQRPGQQPLPGDGG
jgi:hypothetical protein